MKRLKVYICISLLTGILACLLNNFTPVPCVEKRLWDYRQYLIADKSDADKRIKIIEIGQRDLDFYSAEEFQTWPWPRSYFGAMVNYLNQAGARGVVIDILFTEHAVHQVHEDQVFAELAQGASVLVNAVAGSESKEFADPDTAKAFKDFQVKQAGKQRIYDLLQDKRGVLQFPSAALPVDTILLSSDALGLSSAQPDADGVIRHFRIGGLIGDTPVLSLPLALYFNTVPEQNFPFEKYFNDERLLVPRFFGPRGTYQTYAASDILASFKQLREERQPIVPLSEFRDCWVLIGATAPGLLDYRPIPLPGSYPGVELNASVLDNLLNQHFIRTLRFYQVWIYLFSLVFVAAGIQILLRSIRSQLFGQSVLLVVLLTGSVLAAQCGYWLPLTAPLLAFVILIVLSLLYEYQSEGKQRRFIKKAFSHYLSPEVIELVLEHPESLTLGGARRELTIFFSDIAGFTTISEQLEAAQLVQFLNRYLGVLTDIILMSGGTLDKYQGDAIIAFWNAPLEVPNHPRVAVQAALECQQKLAELADEFYRDYGIQVKTRIGLHTGQVNVGNFGSKARFDYTIIGDAANLASRLEGVNKVFGTQILISGSTQAALQNSIPSRRLGTVRVVGKSEKIEVFEPLGEASPVLKLRTEFENALKSFESGDLETARLSFSRLPDDTVSGRYLERIEIECLAQESGEFDPVWNLKGK